MNKKSFFLGILLGVVTATVINFGFFVFVKPGGLYGNRWEQRAEWRKNMREKFIQRMELSDEQLVKLSPLMDEFQSTIGAARKQQLETSREAMNVFAAKSEGILTPDQKVKLAEMRERFEKRRMREDVRSSETVEDSRRHP